MSEQTSEQPTAGAPLTPEQQAYLTAQQAAQAATEAAPIAQAQAATAATIGQGERGPLLPAEEKIDQLMAQLKAQSDQLASQQAALTVVQRQMEEAQAAQGGPLTIRYAQGAADKLDAIAAAHPNNPLGTAHFDAAREAVGQLVDASKGVVKGTGSVDAVHGARARLEAFIHRTHARQGGGHVDWSAILDDLELAASEAAKLAAA